MASYDQSPQDEGYSEDPLTIMSTPSRSVGSWLSTSSIAEKTEWVMQHIDQLPTSAVCEIVQRLRPRLYINFFQYLPPEVCLKVLGLLDPISLINTAQASREWMLLALDRKLWEQLYMLEGFRVIRTEIQALEFALNDKGSDRLRPSGSDDEHASKRRATQQRILPTLQADDDSEMIDAPMVALKQSSIFGPVVAEQKDFRPHASPSDSDVQMTSPTKAPSFPQILQGSKSPDYPGHPRRSFAEPNSPYGRFRGPVSNMSSLVVVDRSDGRKKLNWQYLYSQRRRLEANWEAERYANFQLPHPNHPDEAHKECIYTIQHSGKYLVSGSRDKTLRIWDLNTQRLVRAPLANHTGSVLCLQFDADPSEDLIVSGSSDATIILWKFSTGQLLQKIRKAHRESVLNVRFDKRVLVTCSKDKTIKIFNRRPIYKGQEFSGSSDTVDPVPTYLNNYGFNPDPAASMILKPAYTIIGCLEGHSAAVNAVQIYGDEVVSASGDRTVKVWNWTDQTCTRTLVGHSKGIACVQYDGRRVVSGSSDNEVKVFDKVTGLEVASLRGHSQLVRTVQAGFGDLPYSSEEDEIDAKNIDREYFKAVESGAITREMLARRGKPKNAGSRRPEDITAYGAKLPPGGGGGKFGRIVSGSYDETIIIWRRDKEGVWRAQHILRQEEAANTAARAAEQARANRRSQAQLISSPAAPPEVDHQQLDDDFYHALVDQAIGEGPAELQRVLLAHPEILTFSHLAEIISTLDTQMQQTMGAVVSSAAQAQHPLGLPSSSSTAQQPQPQVHTPQAATPNQAPPVQIPIQQLANVPPIALPPTINQQLVPAAAATALQPPNLPTLHHQPANMARVFKLQFDARRIICCSQTSTIVGWDFANGDEQIIEASRFFAPIE